MCQVDVTLFYEGHLAFIERDFRKGFFLHIPSKRFNPDPRKYHLTHGLAPEQLNPGNILDNFTRLEHKKRPYSFEVAEL